MAARWWPLFVGLLCLCLAQPAAAWLADEAHERACLQQGGVREVLHTVPIVADPGACSYNCFRYTLLCKSGPPHVITSSYRPQASDLDFFFYTYPIWPKALIIAVIAADRWTFICRRHEASFERLDNELIAPSRRGVKLGSDRGSAHYQRATGGWL
jgi:hypothetical protein